MARIDLMRDIKKVFNEHRKLIDKAEVIALNRAGASALAQTVIFIRKRYNIKASDLKNEIKITRASKSSKKFRITVSHKGLALVKFGAAKQTKKGVNVTVIKGERDHYKSAFITEVKGTNSKTNHRGVFIRKGKPRLPIKELYGPSAMQLMSSKEAQEHIEKIFQDKFEKELASAIKYVK